MGEYCFFGRPEAGERLRHACNRLQAIATGSGRPVAVVLGPTENQIAWQRELVDSVRDEFVAAGVTVYPSVERAAWTLGALTR